MKYSIKKYIAKLSGEKQRSLEGNELNHKYFAAFEAESLEDQQAVFAKSDAETKWKILINWCFDYKNGYKSLSKQIERYEGCLVKIVEASYDQRDWLWLASIVEPSAEWLMTDTAFNSLLPAHSTPLFLIIRIFYNSDKLRAAVCKNAALLVKLREIANDYDANDDVLQLLVDDQRFFEDIWNEKGILEYKSNPQNVRFHLKNEPWLINSLTARFVRNKATPKARAEIFLTNFLHFKQMYPEDIGKIENAINFAYLSNSPSEVGNRFELMQRLIEEYCSDSLKDLITTLVSLRIDYKNFKFKRDAYNAFRPPSIDYSFLSGTESEQERGWKKVSKILKKHEHPDPNETLSLFKRDLHNMFAHKNIGSLKMRIETAARHFRLQAVEILDGFELLTIFNFSHETFSLLIEDLMRDKKYVECLELLSYLKDGPFLSSMKAALHGIATTEQETSLKKFIKKIFKNRLFSKWSKLAKNKKEFLRGYCYQEFGFFDEAYKRYTKVIATPECPVALSDEARFLIADMLYAGKIEFMINPILGEVALSQCDTSKNESEENAVQRACQAYEFLENNSHPEAANLAGHARHRLNGFNGTEAAPTLNSLGRRRYCNYMLQKHFGELGCAEVLARQEEVQLRQQIEMQQKMNAQQAEEIAQLKMMLQAKTASSPTIVSASTSTSSVEAEPVGGVVMHPAVFQTTTQALNLQTSDVQLPKPSF